EELVWLLRRLNEEWGTAVLVAEHRLERCLPAADRVLAIEAGSVVCDEPPDGFLEWAARTRPELATPGAKLFSLAGLAPLPASVKDARAGLRAAGLLPTAGGPQPAEERRRRRRIAVAAEARGVWQELRDGPA